MGALRTWSGWKHSSHKPALLCVGASRRSSTNTSCHLVWAGCGFLGLEPTCNSPRLMSDNSPPTPDQPVADYVVVARRYRPQTFEELIGQQHVSQALTRAISIGRVGHAYLFTGARGVGKTSAARILAKALNCEQGPSPQPCNKCELCLSVSTGDDVDVLEIDGASNRGIDEIRQLRQNVAVRPSRARYKIYIIDEVHMLTKEAFNALLKTLEEPPEHVKFIFATTEPNKIPVTILSRCQRYDFAGIETTEIQKRLQQIAAGEGVEIEQDAVQILAMRAAGSMRDSQSLLEQLLSTGSRVITASNVTTMLGIAPATRLSQLITPLVERNAASALTELASAISEGAEVSQLIDQLLGYFRDVMTQAVGCDATRMLYALPSQHSEITQIAEKLGIQTLLAIIQILDQTNARMRISTHARTLAEMAVVRICHLEDLDDLATLLGELRDSSESAPTKQLAKKNAATNGRVNSVVPAPPPVATQPSPDAQPRAESAETDSSEPIEVVSAETIPLNSENLETIWSRAVDSLKGILQEQAAEAKEINLDDQGRLVLGFSSGFHKDVFERPNNRKKLEKALSDVCGAKVPLHMDVMERTDEPSQAVPRPKSRREKMADLASQPFVKRAMELFDTDPSRLHYVPPEEN